MSNRIKPVFVMNQEGLSDLEKQAVLDGVSELIKLAQVDDIEVVDFGAWKNNDYKNNDGSLKRFQSVDWYIQRARECSHNTSQLDVNTLVGCLMAEPWKDPEKGGQPHYDILIVHSDMYMSGTNFVIGGALGDQTAISTYRFKDLDDKTKYECIKTETMHELGHVFNLIPGNRTENVDNSLGKHCANRCTMRQGLVLPDDWINITKDRLRYGALCNTCEDDLKDYFRR